MQKHSLVRSADNLNWISQNKSEMAQSHYLTDYLTCHSITLLFAGLLFIQLTRQTHLQREQPVKVTIATENV